ncbi:MAG: adenylyltransferase/cytidyltransferase family protein [Saprospiraceae bacterium]
MKLGITSGCFDILHPMHILFLEKCRRRCDRLIVLVDSDRLIEQTKFSNPVFNEQDRILLLKSLKVVDDAIVFDNMSHYRTIIESFIGSGDIFIYKNRLNFPTSIETSIVEIPNTMNVLILDVNRFSSSTQIKEFLKNNQ